MSENIPSNEAGNVWFAEPEREPMSRTDKILLTALLIMSVALISMALGWALQTFFN